MESNMSLSEEMGDRLGLASFIGCAVCSTACIFTALVIMGYKLVKSVRSYIRVNFLIMLGTAELMFFAGARFTAVSGVCTMVASWLHFSVLGSFAWLLSYVLFLGEEIKARNDDHSLSLVVYSFIGWLLPATIVTIALIWRYTDYRSQDYCWINDNVVMRVLFEGPVIAFTLFTALLLIYVIVKYFKVDPVMRKIRYSVAGSGIRSCVCLLPLLTLVWLLCSYTVSMKTLWLEIIFTISNCVLGLMVFLFMFLFNEEIIQARKSKRTGSGLKRVKHVPRKKRGVDPDDEERGEFHATPASVLRVSVNPEERKLSGYDVEETLEEENAIKSSQASVKEEPRPSTSQRTRSPGSPDSNTKLVSPVKKTQKAQKTKPKSTATTPV